MTHRDKWQDFFPQLYSRDLLFFDSLLRHHYSRRTCGPLVWKRHPSPMIPFAIAARLRVVPLCFVRQSCERGKTGASGRLYNTSRCIGHRKNRRKSCHQETESYLNSDKEFFKPSKMLRTVLVHTAYSVCYSTLHVKCSSFYICFSKRLGKK